MFVFGILIVAMGNIVWIHAEFFARGQIFFRRDPRALRLMTVVNRVCAVGFVAFGVVLLIAGAASGSWAN
jgi:hypothetical protein